MTYKSSTWLHIGFLLIVMSCVQLNPENANSKKINHTIWDSLLHTHVDSAGFVNYNGFIRDSIFLKEYLTLLANNAPNNTWSKNEQLAYWLNLYNASTIKLITKHYPVVSIKNIGARVQIPFINTPWQVEFIHIGNTLYNLDNIEHNIIRERFNEPRIHFALVCAAISCPKLRNEAYVGAKLDKQLTGQTISFLMDTTKNIITKDQMILSKLFLWYSRDFKKNTSLTEFINHYSTIQIDKDVDIDYMEYDWHLNEQKSKSGN